MKSLVECENGDTVPCFLHVSTPESAAALQQRVRLVPYRTAERGAPLRGRPGGTRDLSLLSFSVSEAPFDDLPRQLEDATTFLRDHEADVATLASAGAAVLDFGHSLRLGPRVAVQCDRLPGELIRLAARLDVEIELSLYPADEPREDQS